jgi:hypothetical protein
MGGFYRTNEIRRVLCCGRVSCADEKVFDGVHCLIIPYPPRVIARSIFAIVKMAKTRTWQSFTLETRQVNKIATLYVSYETSARNDI